MAAAEHRARSEVAEAPAPTGSRVTRARVSALTVEPDPVGSLEEAIFCSVRETLDRGGLETSDIDAVVIAADDVADGRSITTMMHATAAGAYLKDEIRVTGGSLTAVGLACTRVATELSERVLVVAWWRPTAIAESIGRSTLDPIAAQMVPPEQVASADVSEALVSCVVSSKDEDATLELEGWALAQSGYTEWLAQTGEPENCIDRLADLLRGKCGALGDASLLVAEVGDAVLTPWARLQRRLGARELVSAAPSYGLADGMARLAMAQGLETGSRAVVAATGLPPFLRTEAVVARRL